MPESTYQSDFKAHARRLLPGWQYDQIHLAARGAAGGKARAANRSAASREVQALLFDGKLFSPDEARAWAEANGYPASFGQADESGTRIDVMSTDGLTDFQTTQLDNGVSAITGVPDDDDASVQSPDSMLQRITKAVARVLKGDMLSSEVHVDVPLGSDAAPKKKKQKKKLKSLPPGKAVVLKALEPSMPWDMASDVYPEVDDTPAGQYLDSQRLVAGIDQEMLAGMPLEDARQAASANLAERDTYYDAVAGRDSAMGGPRLGLDLDLACGNAREPGTLGVDIYPYDHGTVVWDLTLGIPFPDASCRSVRLVSALDAIAGDSDDAVQQLLTECVRVLAPGGRLLLIDDFTVDFTDPSASPGLALIAQSGEGPYEQLMQRVSVRVPATHGAANAWGEDVDALPFDMQLALWAQRTSQDPKHLMADLIQKGEAAELHTPGSETGPMPEPVLRAFTEHHIDERVVPILKSDPWRQILYSVVLSPDEFDTHGDTMSAEEIEKTAHQYLTKSRVVGSEHADPIKAVPVESFIAPQDLNFDGQYGPQVVKQGSWVLGVKIEDPAEWAKVVDGTYTGFSVGGFGLRDKLMDATL